MGILKRRTLIVPGAALTAMQKRRRKPLPFRHLFVGPPSPLMQSKRAKLQQLFCAAKKADAVVEAFAPPPPPRKKRSSLSCSPILTPLSWRTASRLG